MEETRYANEGNRGSVPQWIMDVLAPFYLIALGLLFALRPVVNLAKRLDMTDKEWEALSDDGRLARQWLAGIVMILVGVPLGAITLLFLGILFVELVNLLIWILQTVYPKGEN